MEPPPPARYRSMELEPVPWNRYHGASANLRSSARHPGRPPAAGSVGVLFGVRDGLTRSLE
eukprot:121195-Prymnesium_polylepis.1